METDVMAERGVTFGRLIRAPRERVFQSFLDPSALRRWFGPDGFDTVTHEQDARIGGVWRFTMHGPDGTDYPNWVEYLHIAPPERIQWDQGDVIGGLPWFRTTITFDQVAQGTQVTFEVVFPTKEARDQNLQENDSIEGGKQTLARLAAYAEA